VSKAQIELGRSHRRSGVFNLSLAVLIAAFAVQSERSPREVARVRSRLQPGRFDLRLGNNVTLHRVVQILLRYCLLLSKRRILIHVELSLDLIRLRLGELRLRLQDLTVSLRDLCLCLCNLRDRLLKLTLKLGHLTVGLIHGGLKRPGIELKQQLALLYE